MSFDFGCKCIFVTFAEPRLHSETQQRGKDRQENAGPRHITAVAFRKTQIHFDVTANQSIFTTGDTADSKLNFVGRFCF
jgi:hypothetical protein